MKYEELVRIPSEHVEKYSLHCIQFKSHLDYAYETIFKEKDLAYVKNPHNLENDRSFCFKDNIIIARTTIGYLILKDITDYITDYRIC